MTGPQMTLVALVTQHVQQCRWEASQGDVCLGGRSPAPCPQAPWRQTEPGCRVPDCHHPLL